MKNKFLKGNVWDAILMVVGCAISGFALAAFLVPAQIVAGGASGVATIIYHFTGWPVGVMSFIINVPLFIIGWKQAGKQFAIRSFIAMTLFSVSMDIIKIEPITDDLIMAGIYGGVVLGIGLGLVLHSGASTGGTDLAAQLLRKKFPSVSVSNILFVVDFIIIAISAFFFDTEIALYAILSLFISAKVMDAVIDGFSAGRAFWIITERQPQVIESISTELDRGCTRVSATGTYTEEQRDILLCIVNRNEVAVMKRLIYREDPAAFVMIADAREVLGEGFSPHQT